MKYLLDTCVISELIKKTPNNNVLSWLQNQEENSLFLSALTFGEIQKGIEKAPDEIRKRKLKIWLEEDLRKRFEGKIIPIDLNVAIKWGEVQPSYIVLFLCCFVRASIIHMYLYALWFLKFIHLELKRKSKFTEEP